ncbi:hypothetical protein [[Mycoplasma] testudinis]|uniref:hypothetical protein n=1 Tax=[Mycoplasma] testudinis TaxID=33924 RepID=UPI000480FC4C|nr:hypothetical protein [[Mycoplasma] testudinis]
MKKINFKKFKISKKIWFSGLALAAPTIGIIAGACGASNNNEKQDSTNWYTSAQSQSYTASDKYKDQDAASAQRKSSQEFSPKPPQSDPSSSQQTVLTDAEQAARGKDSFKQQSDFYFATFNDLSKIHLPALPANTALLDPSMFGSSPSARPSSMSDLTKVSFNFFLVNLNSLTVSTVGDAKNGTPVNGTQTSSFVWYDKNGNEHTAKTVATFKEGENPKFDQSDLPTVNGGITIEISGFTKPAPNPNS